MRRGDDGQINGKVKILKGDGKAEDVKAGVEQDPDADVAISCPLCGAMFDLRTGENIYGSMVLIVSLRDSFRATYPRRYTVVCMHNVKLFLP